MDYLTLEGEGTAFLSNAGSHSSDTAVHSKRRKSSAARL
jgi:hypothetical protein